MNWSAIFRTLIQGRLRGKPAIPSPIEKVFQVVDPPQPTTKHCSKVYEGDSQVPVVCKGPSVVVAEGLATLASKCCSRADDDGVHGILVELGIRLVTLGWGALLASIGTSKKASISPRHGFHAIPID